jgi:hypothetical protein
VNLRPELGVNVVGYFSTESGLGAAARGYVRALRSLAVPCSVRDVSELSVGHRAEDRTLTGFDLESPHEVNLVCVNAEQHFSAMEHLGADWFGSRYNIAAWAWELPRFPAKWSDRFRYYDEIWAGSSFTVNALAEASPIPVVRVPPVLTGPEGSRDGGRRRLVADDEFVFLFVFDFKSFVQRKNPIAVIDAFMAAFVPHERVRLVIKCVNAESSQAELCGMRERSSGYPIEIYDGYWSRDEVLDLMAACDCYVSLHRSEGIGLTIAEAMAQAKPVVATGWSGNMDFMNIGNSFPVRYDLVPIENGAGPYREGEVWADPSIDHAAEQMRYVADHRDEASGRGRAARHELEASFSDAEVGTCIASRLDVISRRDAFRALRGGLGRGDLVPPYVNYRRVVRTIREIATSVLPPGARGLVTTKGDDALLDLPGLEASHFPSEGDGAYAGHHPADSGAAIAQLEAGVADGARFLLFPNTAFWWLDHYEPFFAHLDGNHRRTWRDEHCIIYELRSPGSKATIVSTGLEAELASLSTMESDLRSRLLRAHDHGLHRYPAFSAPRDSGYEHMKDAIRAVARGSLPAGPAIVVSRGDEDLLQLDGREAWHYPLGNGGVYAGFYPPDSAAAVGHLEELIRRGARFLIFPSTGFWWLAHYDGLRRYLDERHARLWSDQHCIVYELGARAVRRRWRRRARLRTGKGDTT